MNIVLAFQHILRPECEYHARHHHHWRGPLYVQRHTALLYAETPKEMAPLRLQISFYGFSKVNYHFLSSPIFFKQVQRRTKCQKKNEKNKQPKQRRKQQSKMEERRKPCDESHLCRLSRKPVGANGAGATERPTNTICI